MHVQKMFQFNREIKKYKKSLENIRPKTHEFNTDTTCCYSARSEKDLKFNIPCNAVSDDDEPIRPQSCAINEVEYLQEEEGEEEEEVDEYYDIKMTRSLSPFPIPSQYLIDESYTMNGIDVDNSIQKQLIQKDPQLVSPLSSTQMENRTVISPQPISQEIRQTHEDFEFIIKPTIMVNIQDTIQPNLPHQSDFERTGTDAKPTSFIRESKIAVNQHMSIFIKKLSTGIVDQKSTYDSFMKESTEGEDIIRDVFNKESHDDFLLLQKYFLRWVHFNTIEKLKRRNPAQTRLQKMESFLQNITLERKRALNKLRKPGNLLAPSHSDEYRRMNLHDPCAESPRLLIRTYNNK